jgi:predicted negative regulator of RcsB-dependent stress response
VHKKLTPLLISMDDSAIKGDILLAQGHLSEAVESYAQSTNLTPIVITKKLLVHTRLEQYEKVSRKLSSPRLSCLA